MSTPLATHYLDEKTYLEVTLAHRDGAYRLVTRKFEHTSDAKIVFARGIISDLIVRNAPRRSKALESKLLAHPSLETALKIATGQIVGE